MEELADELIVMICQYALYQAKGLWLTSEPSSTDDKCKIRYQGSQTCIALGLIFTNRRLSRIAIPIVYGENTFCFSMLVGTAVEFLESLPRTHLERIKRIYFPDSVEPSAASRIDDNLASSAVAMLRQMSLEHVSIETPRYSSMQGESYRSTVHGRLSHEVCSMFREGRLENVRFVMRGQNRPRSWEWCAYIFRDEIVTNFLEPRLFDRTTLIVLQSLRRPYAKWKNSNPPRGYDKNRIKRGRAEYRKMLRSVRSEWESKGVTVKGRPSHLKVRRWVIELKKLKTGTKKGQPPNK